jgi:hypothetical protein
MELGPHLVDLPCQENIPVHDLPCPVRPLRDEVKPAHPRAIRAAMTSAAYADMMASTGTIRLRDKSGRAVLILVDLNP